MKSQLNIWIALVCAFELYSKAQSTPPPVLTTNWITADPSFREVRGQLYNTERSVLWKAFDGKCLNVSSNGILVQTFTMKAVYQATTKSIATHDYMGSITGYRIVPTTVQTGAEEAPGLTLFLRNYPLNQNPATGETISFRALQIGTIDFNGSKYEFWDYGTPHVVQVVSTNSP